MESLVLPISGSDYSLSHFLSGILFIEVKKKADSGKKVFNKLSNV